MKLVVGLGNPGDCYDKTRHNIGFTVVDLVAAAVGEQIARNQGKSLTGITTYQGHRFMLAKPQTFMNNSGEAVRLLVDYFDISCENVLIIYDDLALPTGRLRLRGKGSAGGHNGVRSIIKYLGTESFPRLRIGIGAVPVGAKGMDYVLGRFKPDEVPVMQEAASAASQAVLDWLALGLDATMSKVNRNDPAEA